MAAVGKGFLSEFYAVELGYDNSKAGIPPCIFNDVGMVPVYWKRRRRVAFDVSASSRTAVNKNLGSSGSRPFSTRRFL